MTTCRQLMCRRLMPNLALIVVLGPRLFTVLVWLNRARNDDNKDGSHVCRLVVFIANTLAKLYNALRRK